MSIPILPLTDAELARALTPPAGMLPPAGLTDRIAGDIRGVRQLSAIATWPGPLRPTYPDQRNRWALVAAAALLIIALIAAALAVGRHGPLTVRNGNLDIQYHGGYLDVPPDGSGVTFRAYPNLDDGAGFAWSPDGASIAFWGSADRRPTLVVSSADGQVQARFDVEAELGITSGLVTGPDTVAWAPDGRRLILDGAFHGLGRLIRVDLDSHRIVDITPPGVPGSRPAWSPVDDRIAFIPDDETAAGRRIWVVRSDGSDAHPLFESLPPEWTAGSGWSVPAWAPDGRQIAFDAQRGGLFRVYVVDRDGTGLRQLAPDLRSPFLPVWSPDGDVELSNYLGLPEENFDIWLSRRDGSDARLVVRDGDFIGFSPDGMQIVYSSPSCDTDRRNGNQCFPAIWSVNRATGVMTMIASIDQLRGMGTGDVGIGLGWAAWRGIAP